MHFTQGERRFAKPVNSASTRQDSSLDQLREKVQGSCQHYWLSERGNRIKPFEKGIKDVL